MCTCKMNVFSLARKIKRGLTIVNPDGEHEARIADSLEFEPLILQLFGCKSIMLTFIPHWIRYFDTAYLSKKKYKELEKQKEGVA